MTYEDSNVFVQSITRNVYDKIMEHCGVIPGEESEHEQAKFYDIIASGITERLEHLGCCVGQGNKLDSVPTSVLTEMLEWAKFQDEVSGLADLYEQNGFEAETVRSIDVTECSAIERDVLRWVLANILTLDFNTVNKAIEQVANHCVQIEQRAYAHGRIVFDGA